MATAINGRTYFRTGEVCQMVGISRNTLFRWLKEGITKAGVRKDRRGWRLFTKGDVDKIKAESRRIELKEV